jgi:peptidoglycan/xylan/chitin deacetylase (PgdA/CDA1 family)
MLSDDQLFELANHSYSHAGFHLPCYGLGGVSKSSEPAEIEKTDVLLRKYATSYRKLFRFPGLCFDADAVRSVEGQGYVAIGGDVYAGDGFSADPLANTRRILDQIRPGSIVILHMHGGPNAPHTAAILSAMIPKLRARGYSFVKVSDLLSLAEHSRRQDAQD